MTHAGAQLRALSQWIDRGNQDRDPEAITWGRLAKVAEEAGEVIAAYIGATGQNPRKGRTHLLGDVQQELLDVAVTALAAVAHLHGNQGPDPLRLLEAKVAAVAARAGVVEGSEPAAPWCESRACPRLHRVDTPCDLGEANSP